MNLSKPKLNRKTAMKLWIEEHSDYAKEQVVLNNQGMVGIVLKSLNLNPLDEDLFSIGLIGLVKAVNTFNPDKGVKFSTYAVPIIRNEILMAFRKKQIIPTFSLDENGEKIHNIEISVCVVFEIDGKEKSFRRELKENWVTKRGTSERTLQGNVGTYSVDDYPKSEKEYKECITGIVGEDLFKILTSPTYFPSMKWQEQREILMRFVTDISDVELAGQDKRFADLISELEKAPSTDDIKKKYQKALNEWKKKQAELPVRIDEVEKQKVDIDVAKLELLKNSLNEKIAENKAKQEDISKEFEEQQKASDGILELKFELNDLQRKANEELEKQRRKIGSEKFNKEQELISVKADIKRLSAVVVEKERKIAECKNNMDKIYAEWQTADNRTFDESNNICAYCGQELPEDKKELLLKNFKGKKETEKSELNERGRKEKERARELTEYVKGVKEEIADSEKKKSELEVEISALKTQYNSILQSIDISDRPEVQEIQKKIAEKEQAMKKGNGADEIRQQLKGEEEELQNQMNTVNEQFVYAKKNMEIDKRIAELQ